MLHFLDMKEVSYAYPEDRLTDRPTVNNVNVQIAPGTIHCLIGRSGCGKSTLLKLAAGLLRPSSGIVVFQGQVVDGPLLNMGYVFQSPTLLTWLDVMQNVLLPISLHRQVTSNDREKAQQLLVQMGLDGFETRRPQQLSGGQQSRVAIARALMTAPSILFMDEPFSALDAITREELQHDFLTLCRQQGSAVFFVTHDITEAVYLGDAVSVMAAGRIAFGRSCSLVYPRQAAIRYSSGFNALCEELRQAMDGSAMDGLAMDHSGLDTSRIGAG
jgi:NitT/TauT family transport system ATP-binding protein